MALCNHIIVPLDGSDLSAQALPAARLMANATNAPLTLLRSFGEVPAWQVDARQGRFRGSMAVAEHDRTMAALAGDRRILERAGVTSPVYLEAHQGPAHEVIIDRANRDPNALVVMSTHGRGGLSRMLTGSVTARVVRAVRNPTLIVRCNQQDCPVVPPRFENVIVPLDGSGFSENALDYAGELAAAFGARMTLFRSTPHADYFRVHTDWSHANGVSTYKYNDPVDLARDLSHAAEEYLWRQASALRARFNLSDVEVVNSMATPQQAIVRLAGEPGNGLPGNGLPGNGLVVMATHGRRSVGRALFGSVADHVVRHSPTPTLLVRGPMHAVERAAARHGDMLFAA